MSTGYIVSTDYEHLVCLLDSGITVIGFCGYLVAVAEKVRPGTDGLDNYRLYIYYAASARPCSDLHRDSFIAEADKLGFGFIDPAGPETVNMLRKRVKELQEYTDKASAIISAKLKQEVREGKDFISAASVDAILAQVLTEEAEGKDART